jgi:dipeptide/tripeptide permease
MASMLFGPSNYKLLAAAFALIIIGFVAMYMENEVNGIISLFISPILIVAGYGLVVYALLKSNNNKESNA